VIFKRRREDEEPVVQYTEEVEEQYLTADDATVLGASFTPDGQLRTDSVPDLAAALDPHPETPDIDEGYVAYAEVRPHLAQLGLLVDERAKLIEICLYARDRVNSPAAAERIDTSLAGLGITMLRPDGEVFDPALHEASASVPTVDPALHGLVAETEIAGYADRGALVRPPVVSVYRREDGR
jgi:molecular chaperone GrpE